MSPVILAVDPGLSGAACRLENGVPQVIRDFKCRADIAKAIQSLSAGVTHCVLELVHAMPGQGVVSMFSFGRSAGVIDGAFTLCFPSLVPEEVTPQKWQSYYRAKFGIEKGQPFDSRALACKLFPAMTALFRRVKDHNTADAVLMATWKMEQLVNAQ